MSRFVFVVGGVIVVAISTLVYGMSKYARFSFDGASDDDVAQRYRLVCGAYPDVSIDQTKVPAELRLLLPFAKKYGHGNRILLEDCVAKMTPSEVVKTIMIIDAHRDDIERWIAKNTRLETASEVSSFRQLLDLRQMLRPAISGKEKIV